MVERLVIVSMPPATRHSARVNPASRSMACALGAATIALGSATPAARAAPADGVPVTHAGPTGRRALDTGWYVRLDPAGRGIRSAAIRPAGSAGRPVRVPYSPNAGHVTDARALASYRGSIAWFRDRRLGRRGRRLRDPLRVRQPPRARLARRPPRRPPHRRLPARSRSASGCGAGRHRLVVRADWRRPDRMRDEGWFRTWFNFGGINREVTIRRLAASELDSPGRGHAAACAAAAP